MVLHYSTELNRPDVGRNHYQGLRSGGVSVGSHGGTA